MKKIFIILLALLPVMQVQAQKTKPSKQEVVIVDDEACGCELVFIDGIQTTERNGLFGFKKADGTELVTPQYKFVGQFQDGFCIVMRDEEKIGLINRNGEEILHCDYLSIILPTEGLVKAQTQEGLWGFWDTLGTEVVHPIWKATSSYFEGLAVVGKSMDDNPDNDELVFGYIDHKGTVVIAPQFEYAYPFQNGYAVVKRYDRFGMIDHKGREVMVCKYDFLSPFSNKRCFGIDSQHDHLAMINDKFETITDYVYEDVVGYGNGLYSVKRDGKYTFLDNKGKEHFGMYEFVGSFIDGRCMVVRDGKYGIIDNKGRIILPIEYDNSGYRSEEYLYYEGLALVEKDKKFGYVDRNGHIVIPLIYESGYRFTEGIAPVKDQKAWGYVDKEGNMAIPFIFDACSPFEYGRAEAVFHGEVFKINPKGQCVKNCKNFPKYPKTNTSK